MIAEAMKKVEEKRAECKVRGGTRVRTTELEVVEGMQFAAATLSPYFITTPRRYRRARSSLILLHEKKMHGLRPCSRSRSCVQGPAPSNRRRGYRGEALATLVVNSCAAPQGRRGW